MVFLCQGVGFLLGQWGFNQSIATTTDLIRSVVVVAWSGLTFWDSTFIGMGKGVENELLEPEN